MKKEIKVQNLCSDTDEVIVMSFCVIICGIALMMLVFGLMYLAALFN